MDDLTSETEQLIDDLSNRLATDFLQTINLLGSMVSLTERYYEGSHSRFVAEKSGEIAALLGMNDTDVFEIKTAGLIHDIGKIGSRDSLLVKNMNEMNQTDLKQYMIHPELGMRILSRHRGFNNIGEIILQHHEKADGSGFPRHLQLTSIHPGALIISVVDTYHNIMYKKSKDKAYSSVNIIKYTSTAAYIDSTRDKYAYAMNYLNQKKGLLFDREIVDKFTEILQLERNGIGKKTVIRVHVGKLDVGMIFAEDYFTSYGLLIAAKGEKVKPEMIKYLARFAESGDIPQKILVMK